MATSLSQRIVSSKVDILMEQRNHLQTFVDETDKVLQMATSWLRNEDTTKSFTYSDMKKMIDEKLDFLVSTDFSVGCKEVTTEQEPVATRSFPSAPKSTDQPLPAGQVHVSDVTVASDELKTILSQVKVMQEAISSLSTSSQLISEKQLAMEKLVESLSDKYSKVEQEKLREIEESIKEKHEKAAIQQEKRLTSCEKKIQDVTDSQSDIIENCHQQQIKIKDQKKETEKLKTQSQQFTKDLRDALVNNAATNTQMGALEGEIESLKESLEELSTRFEEHGSSLEELTRKNKETLKVLSSAKESEIEKLQKLEEKLSALENSWSETTVENGKLCQDVETKYEMVCQIVTDRLVPLERLRDIFNGKLDVRTGHIKKEKQTQRQAIGFSAESCYCSGTFTINETLIFANVTSNIGDHYDSKTGEFSAPLDGLYAVYFFVDTIEKAYSSFAIRKTPCSCEDTCSMCVFGAAELHDDVTQTSTFGLVEMKANEKLFVKCWSEKSSISIRDSKFICFKIF